MGLTLVLHGVVNVDMLMITFYSDVRSKALEDSSDVGRYGVFRESQRRASERDGLGNTRKDSQRRR